MPEREFVGPFAVKTRESGKPITLYLQAIGVRRVVEHNGEQVSYVDCRGAGSSILESRAPLSKVER